MFLFLLILFFISVFTLVLSLGRTPKQSTHPAILPTPTPFSSQNSSQSFTKPITILKTLPATGDSNVSIAPTISVEFSRALSPSEKQLVFLTSSPSSSFALPLWSKDNTTASFSATTPFSAQTTYTMTLSYGTKAYNFSFTTKSQNDFSTQDYQAIQTAGDTAFSQKETQIQANYPWINQLPLFTDSYFTYFDTTTKSFVTHIYYSGSALPSAKDQEAVKQQVTNDLQHIGVDTTKYKLVWQLTPVSE